MPSLAALPAVADAAGLPAVSAATATARELLLELGLDARLPGSGALLDLAA